MKPYKDNLDYYENQRSKIDPGDYYYTVKEYGDWVPSAYVFSGWEILSEHGCGWWYLVHWKKNRYGAYMKGDPVTKASVREAIAKKTGRPLDQIFEDLVINARGEGHTEWYGPETAMFHTYTVGYKYREIKSEKKLFDSERYNSDVKACEKNIRYWKESSLNMEKAERFEESAKQNRQTSSSLNSKANWLASEKNKIESNSPALESTLKQAREVLGEKEKALAKKLESLNGEQKAVVFSSYYGKEEFRGLTEKIKLTGLDADYLALVAAEKGDIKLFEEALNLGADCSAYQTDGGKTLLQNLTALEAHDFVAAVLKKSMDLTCTLVKAIEGKDTATLGKILSRDPETTEKKIFGYSLLQIAIGAKDPDLGVIEKILSGNEKIAKVLSHSNESALLIAVRSGKKDVVKKIAAYADLAAELESLGEKLDSSVKEKILKEKDMGAVIEFYEKTQKGAVLSFSAKSCEPEPDSLWDAEIPQKEYGTGIQGLCFDQDKIE